MATFRITEVKVVKTKTDPHKHIVAVRLGDGTDLSLSQVVSGIRNGDHYISAAGKKRTEVYEIKCPRCHAHDYITTHPDKTKKNNLLKLPRFY